MMSRGEDTVSDAELMRYLHDELDEAGRAHVDAQLATPAVAERLSVMRQRTRRLSSLLGAADPAPSEVEASARELRLIVTPARRGASAQSHRWHATAPPLRAAAAIVILLGGVLLVEPARAWVIDSLRAAAVAVGLVEGAATPHAPVLPQTSGAGVRFSFAWSAPSIDVDAGGARGTLVIRRGVAGRVTAESRGAAAAGIVIMPDGIRLEGAGDGAAEYMLTLPPAVRVLDMSTTGGRVRHVLPATEDVVRLPLR